MAAAEKECKCSFCSFMEKNADALGRSVSDACQRVCGKDGDVQVVGFLILLAGADGHYGHFLKPPMWGRNLSQKESHDCYKEFARAVRRASENLISEARKGILS